MIPKARNGPNAKWSLRLFFLRARAVIPYRLLVIALIMKATSALCQPRRNPAAAISLTSPPPNEPFKNIANKRRGKLTAKKPIILSAGVMSGKSQIAEIPIKNSAMFKESGISLVFISMIAIAISTNPAGRHIMMKGQCIRIISCTNIRLAPL